MIRLELLSKICGKKMVHPVKAYFRVKKRRPHARPGAGLEPQSKAGGRDLIFISPELGAMNNKLPRRGEYLLHYCASQKCKNDFSSQRPPRL